MTDPTSRPVWCPPLLPLLLGAGLWALLGWAVLGCSEPPSPTVIIELPDPCEYPMALNYLGECVPTMFEKAKEMAL